MVNVINRNGFDKIITNQADLVAMTIEALSIEDTRSSDDLFDAEI